MPSVPERRDSDVLTVAEAAEILGLSRNGAYRLVQTGQMPGAVRLGGSWRISRPRLLAAIHGAPTAA